VEAGRSQETAAVAEQNWWRKIMAQPQLLQSGQFEPNIAMFVSNSLCTEELGIA